MKRILPPWLSALALVALLLLSGCAADPKRFTLGELRAADLRRLLWPPSENGAVPRYVFNGLIVGEENFIKMGDKDEIKFKDVVRFLIGTDFSSYENPTFLYKPQFGLIDEVNKRIFVTDMAFSAIFVFDEAKGRMEVWRDVDDFFRFSAPTGIALGHEGDVFVADANLAQIMRLNKEGKVVQIFGRGQLKRPTGIAYDRLKRRLYVSDTHGHAIKVFDANGTLMDDWGERGGEEELAENKTGAEVSELTLNYPTHMVLSRGKLYVTDTMNARIYVLSAETGRTHRVIGKRGLYIGNMVRPKGIAVDSEENIYVVEGYHDHLLVYNRDGDFLMSIGGGGNGPGQFNQPNGVWVDSRDRVFVADSDNSRVQVFQFLGGGSENID